MTSHMHFPLWSCNVNWKVYTMWRTTVESENRLFKIFCFIIFTTSSSSSPVAWACLPCTSWSLHDSQGCLVFQHTHTRQRILYQYSARKGCVFAFDKNKAFFRNSTWHTFKPDLVSDDLRRLAGLKKSLWIIYSNRSEIICSDTFPTQMSLCVLL